MAVWTISAQPGTPGVEVAHALAARAGVPLFDRKALEPLVHELSPEFGSLDDVEGRFGGRLNAMTLALAMTYGAPRAPSASSSCAARFRSSAARCSARSLAARP